MPLVEPRSVAAGTTAAKRRVIKGATGATAVPTVPDDKGFRTGRHEYLHGTLKSTVGTSFDLTLWGKYDFAEEWFVVDWFGTAGVLQVVTATNGGILSFEPLVIKGLDAVFAQISAVAGGGEIADVWLGVSSFD